MGSAAWLSIRLPLWYFKSVLHPFTAGVLTIVPAMGVWCLTVGTVFVITRKQWNFLFFLLSITFSHAYVALSGFLRGEFPQGSISLALIFLSLQITAIGFAAYKCIKDWATIPLIAAFCITYAVYAQFVAGMSLSDVWL